MEEFTIQGGSDFLKITFFKIYGFPESTGHFGGYDTESIIEINCDGFKIKAAFYISTGEIFEFYEALTKCNESLTGIAYLRSYEGNLEFSVEYDLLGHTTIKGVFSKQNQFANRLTFEIFSDQTYIQHTLIQLREIVAKYGGKKGIK
jgi:hypothetical protein